MSWPRKPAGSRRRVVSKEPTMNAGARGVRLVEAAATARMPNTNGHMLASSDVADLRSTLRGGRPPQWIIALDRAASRKHGVDSTSLGGIVRVIEYMLYAVS